MSLPAFVFIVFAQFVTCFRYLNPNLESRLHLLTRVLDIVIRLIVV